MMASLKEEDKQKGVVTCSAGMSRLFENLDVPFRCTRREVVTCGACTRRIARRNVLTARQPRTRCRLVQQSPRYPRYRRHARVHPVHQMAQCPAPRRYRPPPRTRFRRCQSRMFASRNPTRIDVYPAIRQPIRDCRTRDYRDGDLSSSTGH